ncbi:MAG: pilus assembly protein PilP [Burkholderiales bacterium]|nr:pilus assembly protein PilP [Burkholderiales bacterium]
MKARILLAATAAALLLAACEGGEHSDLRAELDRLTRDLPRRVDPLPQVKPYQPVPYEAFDVADPFGPAKIELATKSAASGGGGALAPDLNRPKEPLEAYPLETLTMVGTLTRQKQSYALVKADTGLYRVRVGNYLGQNFGVITRITDSEITLRELIQDSAGDWAERESALLLQEAGATTEAR